MPGIPPHNASNKISDTGALSKNKNSPLRSTTVSVSFCKTGVKVKKIKKGGRKLKRKIAKGKSGKGFKKAARTGKNSVAAASGTGSGSSDGSGLRPIHRKAVSRQEIQKTGVTIQRALRSVERRLGSLKKQEKANPDLCQACIISAHVAHSLTEQWREDIKEWKADHPEDNRLNKALIRAKLISIEAQDIRAAAEKELGGTSCCKATEKILTLTNFVMQDFLAIIELLNKPNISLQQILQVSQG